MKKLLILMFFVVLSVSKVYADDCSIIKGTVWYDENADGLQNDNTTLVTNGVKVYLYNEDDDLIDEKDVNADGSYEFQVQCGNYYIKVDKGDYNYYSHKDVGNDDTIDSDVDENSGESDLFSINAGETKILDAGLNCGCDDTASLNGKVWFDENGNGIQDSGENGIAGVTVHLLKDGEDTGITTTTDENGNYEFSDLECGHNYSIKVDKPSDYDKFTTQNSGSDDSVDSDVDSSGISDSVNVDECQEYGNLDVGLANDEERASLNGKVWFDENGNGIQDSGENGIAGVTVHLLKDGEDTGITTTTDENGNYEFSDLECGHNYSIKVDKPSDYDKFTMQNSGNDDTKDSDVNSSGISDEVNVAECQEYSNLDAGLANDKGNSNNGAENETKTACLGDFLWLDKNLNGIQDTDEPGVVGVGVYLYDNSGKLLATTQTDSNGEYSFCGLRDGEYRVKFDLPNTYLFTKRDSGDDTKDSDVDSSGWSYGVAIKDRKSDYSIDAGIYCECDDYKVNPNEYKKVSGGVSLEMVLGLLIFVFIAVSSLKYKRD